MVDKSEFRLFLSILFFFTASSFVYAAEVTSSDKEWSITRVFDNTLIITDKNCSFCTTKIAENLLKDNFSEMRFKVIDYREGEAKKLIKDQGIKTLPSFVVDPLVKQENVFKKGRVLFEKESKGKILLKTELAGICLFLEREEVPKRLDLFLDFYQEGADRVFDSLVSFSKENKVNFSLYFVSPQDQDKKVGYFQEEIEVALAVKKLYPDKLNDYIYRRIKDIENKSWIDVADGLGISYKKVKDLRSTSLIDELVKENWTFAKEVMVGRGNVILVKNNRIFQVVNIDKDELKSLFKE